MKTKVLGALAVSALLGAALASSTGFAQERQRGFDGPRGEARGAPRQVRPGMRSAARRVAAALPDRFIVRHDTDADGKVSETEFLDASLQRIDTLIERRDADGNGQISADEQAAPRGMPGRRGIRGGRERPARAERPEIDRDAITACVRESIADYQPRFDDERQEAFGDIDTNGDNELSLQEINASVAARARAMFAHIDSNDDGYVTEDEAAAHFQQQHEVRRAVRTCALEQRAG